MGWVGGRAYRQKITIQEGNVFDDHEDFPVAIKITGSNGVFTKAQSDGYDILFAADDDVRMDYERVRWDPGSELLFIYVRTDLSSSEATEFYMYYGNGGNTITVDGQNPEGVWASHYKGVYHFEEASGQLQDSTSNARNSTTANQIKYHYAGLHSYACYFDGSGDYAILPSSLSIGGNAARTVTAYFYPEWAYNQMGTWSPLLRLGGESSTLRSYILSLDNGGECSPSESIGLHYWGTNTCTGERVVSSGDEILLSTWHQYAGTHDGSTTQRVFLNGTQRGTSSYTLNTVSDVSYIAYRPQSGVYYRGRLSEIRVSSTDLGSDWVRTEYENMINNDTFFVLSAEEDTPYLLEDIPTAVTVYDSAAFTGTRNYITSFTIEAASTTYMEQWVALSLADLVQTTSGINDIESWLGFSGDGGLADSENDKIVDFTVSTSGILGTTPRDTTTEFTVATEPVPVTDPYGGIDVDIEFIRGLIVSNPNYGEDVDVEFYLFGTYDTESDLDIDFTLSTYDIPGAIDVDVFGSTFSGTYGLGSQGIEPTYPDWIYRRQISVDGTKVASSLTDFPMVVTVTGSNSIFTNAQSDGRDIFFTSSDGVTKLSHELSRYSVINEELVAYVKCDLSGSGDTFYIYYGNTTSGLAAQEDPTNVWDSNYYSVYHFEEPSGDLIDSTNNNRDGSPSNVSKNQDTILGKGYYFNGSNSYVQIYTGNGNPNRIPGDRTHTYKELTVALYCKPGTGNDRGIFSVSEGVLGGGGDDRHIYFDTSGNVRHRLYGAETLDTDDQDWADNQWHQIAVAYGQGAGKNHKIIVDGQTRVTGLANEYSDFDWNNYHYIGFAVDPGNDYFNGYMTEVRISRIYRDVGWLSTEYENIINNSDFFTLGGEEYEIVWLLGDYYEAEVTTSGALSYPIDVDVFASISGTQYNIESDLYVSLANTYDGYMYDDPVTFSGIHYPLISGSYYDAEATVSGAIWYPVVQDIYVSLADSVSGQPPVLPPNSGGAHFIDQTISGGNYVNVDTRLFALQIDNFFLDVDEYAVSTSTMAVDITDRRGIKIDTSNCYFVIDGVTITSGIYFTPVERTTASGYRMYYDPPGDFVADEPIEVIVHGENVINDWLEETYTLLWGYNLVVNRPEFHSWGWDKEVVVWSKASNVASCPAESADAWHISTAPQPYKDLAASIVPQVKRKDLSAVIYPISTAIFYGGKYKITVNLKDLAGNEMPPFTLEFTVEDKPN